MPALMIDIAGEKLSQEDTEILQHPSICGVIYFQRNYHDPAQLNELSRSIRECREDLIIAVDQEGGRVQRFKEQFVELPASFTIGKIYSKNKIQAIKFATLAANIMASEILACGIDFSFAPVLDLYQEQSKAINTRAYSSSPHTIIELGKHYINAMHELGMAACGKHFPGHGYVVADSHEEIPVDSRVFDDILHHDLQPFIALMSQLTAIMPAHVCYPEIDQLSAGFSPKWLQDILRKKLNYTGVIISDDMNMQGAKGVGDYPTRVMQAHNAGCDLVLLCNNRDAVISVLDNTKTNSKPHRFSPLQTLRAKKYFNWFELHHSRQFKKWYQELCEIKGEASCS